MLSSLLWLSPVAQDVLRTSTQLLKGVVPCPLDKFCTALREASDDTAVGILCDATLRSKFADDLKGSGIKEVSDKTAPEIVEVFGKTFLRHSEDVKSKAAALSKSLPLNSSLPSYSEVLKLLPTGEKPSEALQRDWLLWHSIGEIPAPSAKVAAERLAIAASAGSGPSVEHVLALHVLDNLKEYTEWETSLPGSQPKATSKGLKCPFDEKAAKEVALRRILTNALPPAVADAVAVQVSSGGDSNTTLTKLAAQNKATAVLPRYVEPAAPKEVKDKKDTKEGKESKEGKTETQKGAASKQGGSSNATAASGGALAAAYKATATQELQWQLLAYRLRPGTSMSNATAASAPAKSAAAVQSRAPVASASIASSPTGFAGLWSPLGTSIPPGHTPYTWLQQDGQAKAQGFPILWTPRASTCPPGHTAYTWSEVGANNGTATGPSGGQKEATKSSGSTAPKNTSGGKEKAPAAPKKETAATTSDQPADGSDEAALCKLDIRCGRILDCQRVPDADSLYLLKVNVGEDQPRQVVSSLVKYYKEDELTNRQVIVYCNIKPGKMRGFESQAMVLAATSGKGTDDEKCELLKPPQGIPEGTRPACGKLEVGSLSASQNVKNISKVWAQVQPLLQTNAEGEATFAGTVLTMDKAPVKADSLGGVPIY